MIRFISYPKLLSEDIVYIYLGKYKKKVFDLYPRVFVLKHVQNRFRNAFTNSIIVYRIETWQNVGHIVEPTKYIIYFQKISQ